MVTTLREELDAASKLRDPDEYRERIEALRSQIGHAAVLPSGTLYFVFKRLF